MKTYQCSKCKHLTDYDDYCACSIGIDLQRRNEAAWCKESFEPLEPGKEWHERFRWEK